MRPRDRRFHFFRPFELLWPEKTNVGVDCGRCEIELLHTLRVRSRAPERRNRTGTQGTLSSELLSLLTHTEVQNGKFESQRLAAGTEFFTPVTLRVTLKVIGPVR